MLSGVRRKICIVNPFEHGGGAEYQISLLIDALSGSGEFEIHYLTHFPDQRDRTRNYQVSRIGDGGPIPRLGYVVEARSLYRLLREIGPDIIYQRVACAYTAVCALYARRRGVPLIWHVSHDTELTPGHLDRTRNFLRLRLEKWLAQWGGRHATGIVVQTQFQAELLTRNYARTADAVIPNFHPPAAEPIDKSGPLTVLWVANLKPWKQPEIFVRLAQSLKDRGDIRFVMVGAAAPPGKRWAWESALMSDIHTAANLQYLGEKTQEEVNALLARAHIFVNTSRHEGFPNTFIQAWLRDVAVVSLQVDPDQVLARGGAGIVAHSEAALVAAVRDLIDAPQVRAGFVARGREHAQVHHSLRNAEVLGRLLGGTAGDRPRTASKSSS
jgi:glycosyltransferase involved in cell wall biosynthesis